MQRSIRSLRGGGMTRAKLFEPINNGNNFGVDFTCDRIDNRGSDVDRKYRPVASVSCSKQCIGSEDHTSDAMNFVPVDTRQAG